jgi:hypothetical protein
VERRHKGDGQARSTRGDWGAGGKEGVDSLRHWKATTPYILYISVYRRSVEGEEEYEASLAALFPAIPLRRPASGTPTTPKPAIMLAILGLSTQLPPDIALGTIIEVLTSYKLTYAKGRCQ